MLHRVLVSVYNFLLQLLKLPKLEHLSSTYPKIANKMPNAQNSSNSTNVYLDTEITADKPFRDDLKLS